MNWYHKSQIKEYLIKLSKIKDSSLLKTASILGSNPITELDWKGQTEDEIELGNFQRYVCDSQTVKIFMTKTVKKIAISLITTHTYLGTAGWSIYWEFNLDQMKEAKKIFKKVCEIARDVTEYFITKEIPTVSFHATLRQRFKEIEREDVIRTNIPIINYSYDIPYETDWRSSIYGNRYPTYKEDSFKQYLNSSIYSQSNPPSGKFAL